MHSVFVSLVLQQEMIAKTAGAELCATHEHSKPMPSDCVRAYDETYKGRVNLSKDVKVGEPVKKSALHWSVPYDVSDAAGNKAATVWREVIVEEVELESVSSSMRREFEKEKEAAIRKAVDAALAEERTKATSRSSRRQPQKCPDCPKCTCAEHGGGGLDEAACNAICDARKQSCAVDERSWIVRILVWLEGLVPTSLAPVVLLVFAAFSTLLFARFIASFLVEQPSYRPPYDTNPEYLQGHVTVYRSPTNGNSSMNGGFAGGNYGSDTNYGGSGSYGGNNGSTYGGGAAFGSPNRSFLGMNGGGGHPSSAPPRSSMSLGDRPGNSNGLFTPPAVGRPYTPSSTAATGGRSAGASSITDIYEQSPLITPHRRGEGVRRRSRFSR